MQKLGQNIRELRHSWGESLLDLSLVLNKNTSTISQWESGKRTPNNEILYQIANHYKVTVDELLNGDFSDLP
ncbi:TPA: helix-turn-helix domain-containing protein, partial [Streptococcus suis]